MTLLREVSVTLVKPSWGNAAFHVASLSEGCCALLFADAG